MKKMLCKFLGLLVISAAILSICPTALAVGGDDVSDVTFSNVIMNVGSDQTQRNLTWYSESDAAGEVRYGKSENGELPVDYAVAKAVAVKVSKPGYYSYKATLTGLEENTSYVYCLVVGGTVSEPYSFEVHAFGDEFTFAHIADPQTYTKTIGDDWTDSINKIKNSFDGVSFLVSGGDQTECPAREIEYDYFISEQLSSIAIATTIGPPHDNHIRYTEHSNLPNVSSTYGTSDIGANYFYKYNNVLFMHLNVENTDFAGHVSFVENTLADNPDCTWNIVVLHYTYITSIDRSGVSAIRNGRAELMDDFSRLGIDAVLSGHDHIYTRSNLMLDGTTLSNDTVVDNTVTDPEGTLYLCASKVAGTSFGTAGNQDEEYIACMNAQARKSAVIFHVTDTSLTLKSYFLDEEQPELFDQFTINKTTSEAPSVPADSYTVKFVADPDASFGDDTDLSVISERRYTSLAPDAPALYMPRASMSEGELYEWRWAYYQLGGNASEVTEFTYGSEYVAYPVVSAVTPVSNTLYLAATADPEKHVYTWLEAWDIVQRCPGEEFTFVLNEDIKLASKDDIANVSKQVNVTIDLNGKTLNANASGVNYAVHLSGGSDDSVFRIVSSKANGTVIALREVVRLNSIAMSAVDVQFGSESTQPINVQCKYLVFATAAFKTRATVNVNIYGGTYTVADGVTYVTNTNATTTSYNTYTVTAKNAQFHFSGSDSCIIRSNTGGVYRAGNNSYIHADGCAFIDTYTADRSSSRYLIREDIWLGSAVFTDCDFNGMSIGRTVDGAALTACKGITIGEGCTFTNSATTFHAEGGPSFFSNKVTAASGCVLARTDAVGTVEVVKEADAAQITWHNPVGYAEYWKKGTSPVYLGADSFTIGANTYSLLVNGEITVADENKSYLFKSAEGYLFRWNESTGVWQISKDGGVSYEDIAHTHPDGWTAINNTGDGSACITEAGHYYLNDTLSVDDGEDGKSVCLVVNTPNATDEVVICMNGQDIKPGSGVEYAVRMIKGNVTLCNCSEQGGTIVAGSKGPVIRVGDASGTGDITLTLSGNVNVDGNGKAENPVSIYMIGVFKDGHLILDHGSSVSNNHTTSANGIIFLNSGTLTMNKGAEVKNNTVATSEAGSDNSGTIRVYGTSSAKASFTMNGGTISNNVVNENGGGVAVEQQSTFTMKGGEISGNTATLGGGVYLKASTAIFNMDGGTVSNNLLSTGSNGTGVYVDSTGVFTMTDGTISGGGNLVYSKSGTAGSKVSGGTIAKTDSGNHAVFSAASKVLELGGTVSVTGDVAASGLLTISGGTITGNVVARSTTEGVAVTITGGAIDGKLSIKSETKGTFGISGGKFSADTAKDALAGWLATDQGALSVKEISEAPYVYEVGAGFADSGEFMDFHSNLDMSLYIGADAGFSEEDFSEEDYEVTLNGAGVDVSASLTLDETTGSLLLTAHGIAAKEMHDKITFTVMKGDEVWYTKTMSVYDSAKARHDAQDATDAEKQMLADMIHYGIAAQNEWGYNTGAMAELGSASQTVTGDWSATSGAGVSNGQESKVVSTLSLEEKIELNLYIDDARATITNVKFAGSDCSAEKYTVSHETRAGRAITCINFHGIDVVDAKEAVEFTVTLTNGTSFDVKYSIKDYVNQMKDGEQSALLEALQKYVDSVRAYLNA